MLNQFKYLLTITVFALSISSCTQDNDDDTIKTTAKITVIDGTDSSPAENFTVYAIGTQEWNFLGADAHNVAKAQAVTDSNGEVSFNIDDFPGAFSGNSSQDTYYFLVLYTRGSDDYYAYKGITFQKEDQKVETITLD